MAALLELMPDRGVFLTARGILNVGVECFPAEKCGVAGSQMHVHTRSEKGTVQDALSCFLPHSHDHGHIHDHPHHGEHNNHHFSYAEGTTILLSDTHKEDAHCEEETMHEKGSPLSVDSTNSGSSCYT